MTTHEKPFDDTWQQNMIKTLRFVSSPITHQATKMAQNETDENAEWLVNYNQLCEIMANDPEKGRRIFLRAGLAGTPDEWLDNFFDESFEQNAHSVIQPGSNMHTILRNEGFSGRPHQLYKWIRKSFVGRPGTFVQETKCAGKTFFSGFQCV